MRSVSFIGQIRSKGRVQIPKHLREEVSELESGGWYKITIEERVRSKETSKGAIEESGLGNLIIEKEGEKGE